MYQPTGNLIGCSCGTLPLGVDHFPSCDRLITLPDGLTSETPITNVHIPDVCRCPFVGMDIIHREYCPYYVKGS